MKVLIDTNVLLDYLTKREPYYQDARQIILDCAKNDLDGYVAAHSVVDAYFIMRKAVPAEKRREYLLQICNITTIVGIDERKLTAALNKPDFKDFEDCLQYECALEFGIDYIITRNVKDFSESSIAAVTPDKFLQQIGKEQ